MGGRSFDLRGGSVALRVGDSYADGVKVMDLERRRLSVRFVLLLLHAAGVRVGVGVGRLDVVGFVAMGVIDALMMGW
jgi:hypothetical protein